ncbi:MAG: DUF1080 domain-containing protein [Rhodothermales bacterium]
MTAFVLLMGMLLILGTACQGSEWQILFDGTSLEHWRGYRQDSIPAGWSIAEDGSLSLDGEGRGDIMTREQFGDFELMLEWKVSEAGNSGIIYRVSEDFEHSYDTGPEMQVLDNDRHPDGRNPLTSSGAVYAMYPASEEVVKGPGEWNEVRIVVQGSHVEHWLNDVMIVDYELWTDEWRQRVADSKWSERPRYGLNETGYICLQEHGDPVWYRNIKIRRL